MLLFTRGMAFIFGNCLLTCLKATCNYLLITCTWLKHNLYITWWYIVICQAAPYGASINDVQIFGVFFDPLPPPCPNFIYWPLISKVRISWTPSLPFNSDIIYGCSLGGNGFNLISNFHYMFPIPAVKWRTWVNTNVTSRTTKERTAQKEKSPLNL